MPYEIDFLKVGDGEKSGDAIALCFGADIGSPKPQDRNVVIIDGGFAETGRRMVDHVQTYYRTNAVDAVVSSHPDADHVNGLPIVLEEMDVGALVMHRPWLHAAGAGLFSHGRATSVSDKLKLALDGALNLEEIANRKRIPIVEPFTGVTGFGGRLHVVGPTTEYYESLLPDFRCLTQPAGRAGSDTLVAKAARFAGAVLEKLDVETLEDACDTSPENNSGAILHFSIDGERLLFTADTGIPALSGAAAYMESRAWTAPLDFIQGPHHGSHHNLGPTILDRLVGRRGERAKRSFTSFISASADAPKHPSKKVTNALARRGALVVVTREQNICHHTGTPSRPGWVAARPEPLWDDEEDEE